MYPKKHLVFAL